MSAVKIRVAVSACPRLAQFHRWLSSFFQLILGFGSFRVQHRYQT
jgi:hypothetical protein